MKTILIIIGLTIAIKMHGQTNIWFTNDITIKWCSVSSSQFGQRSDSPVLEPEASDTHFDVYSNHVAIVSLNGITNRMELASFKIGSETVHSQYEWVAISTNFTLTPTKKQ